MLEEPTEDKSLALQTLENFISKNNTNKNDLNKNLDKEVMIELIRASDKSDERKNEFKKRELIAQESVAKEHIKASILNEKSERYYVFIALGFAIVITVLVFVFKQDFIEKWLTLLIGLATGLLGGYGLANRKKDTTIVESQQNT